ncbi:Imm47 family immunity protein [Bacillus cereus]|uniref:Imm47 family immunity protein n=1 Tax=Bacillus cereus TaxID=1396 RepID=UPI0039806EF6
MIEGINLMNSIWYGNRPIESISNIKKNILNAKTEKEVLLNLIELFKAGDFSQKQLLIQLMNHTIDERVLNLCIRIFCSIATHEDIRNSNNLTFLASASECTVDTFSTAAITSLSMEIIPYLLVLLEEWDEITDTSMIIRDSIEFFINYQDVIGEEVSVDEIGEFYLNYIKNCDMEKYYFNQIPAFPGDLTKKLFERVIRAANHEEPLKMELIPSLLSIWTGEKVPADYHTIICNDNYKAFVTYIDAISKRSWESGQKYFYGFKLS